jgi:hypothetical protein
MTQRRPTARELELVAAAAPPPRLRGFTPGSEATAMLARRGFEPASAPLDLPFSPDLSAREAERLLRHLGHYAFRLFLRGAIAHPQGFAPREATRYVSDATAEALAESLVDLGLAERLPRGRLRLLRQAHSFGGTLEWYLARELSRRMGFDVATGVKLRAKGVGGDLDVVAAAEGRLVYIEAKSSPPRHITESEVAAFLDRLQALRPDVGLFLVDTALRLDDKVLPMLVAEGSSRRGAAIQPRRVIRDIWALTPHLYALNARHHLVVNVGLAIAEALRSLAPSFP